MDTYLLDANGQLKVPLPPGVPPLKPRASAPPVSAPAGGSAPTEPLDPTQPED
jgi:hypothetical protein